MTASTNQRTQYLDVSKRTEFTRSSLHRLRKNGGIPASVYGGGTEAQSIYVDEKQLARVARTGRTEFFELRIDGAEGIPVLIKDVQQRGGKILHVDFQKVSKNKPIRVKVPLIYNGTAEGTKVGGILQIQATELEIEGLPDVLPSGLEVDVTPLGTGDKLVAADVQLPEGISLIALKDELLASVVLPRVAEPEAEAEGDAGAEPEAADGAGEKE
ncbi:50S ribosomal protein L25 [Paenibacillus woosongensis]|uniref:Large ribosomal subunit protein bL25 n=1 Tax=Paenibacillus woosongensis TaxID=307580 RepID=A0AA95I9X7_9BACL|nr:50S ribosomal protein L25 [Paenibacillus woosongensis]WHX47988.1 50S ribosomal protein L25 [Paenibacillus woosongensis]